MKLLLLFVSVINTLYVAADNLDVKAWQSVHDTVYFPESDVAEVTSKPNTGISFSGGGSRSYIASMGYLGGLHKLGLMQNVRYIIGVSGGSWATAVYSYYQGSDTIGDEELLGPVIMPEDIVYEVCMIYTKCSL